MSYQAPPPPQGGAGYGSGVPSDHPKATQALIIGIVSLICCSPLGIYGLILSRRVRSEIAATGGQMGGDGKAMAGLVLSIIALVWLVISIILFATGAFTLDTSTSTT